MEPRGRHGTTLPGDDQLESARDSARRAGLSLGDWMSAALRERPADEPARRAAPAARPRQIEDEPSPGARPMPHAARNWLETGREERSIAAIGEAIGLIARRLDTIDDRSSRAVPRPLAASRDIVGRIDATLDRIGRAQPPAPDPGLGRLGQRLDEIVERIDEVAGHQASGKVATEKVARLEEKLGKVLEALQAKESRDPAPAFGAVEERLAALADRLERGSRRPPEAVTSADMEALRREIGALARRIEDATQRADGDGLATLREEIGSLRRELVGVAPSRTLDTVRKAIDDLAVRVEEGLARSAQSLAQPRGWKKDIDDLRAQISASVSMRPLEAVRDAIDTLAGRIDGVAAQMRPVDGQALDRLRQEIEGLHAELAAGPVRTLDSVRRALDDFGRRIETSIGDARRGPDSAVLSRLQSDLDALRKELALQPTRTVDALSLTIQDLSERLEQRFAAPAPADETLRHEVAALSQRIDRATRAMPGPDGFGALRDELTQLRAIVADLAPRGTVDVLKTAVDDLTSRLATSTRGLTAAMANQVLGAAEDIKSAISSGNFGSASGGLEAKLDAVARKIDALADAGAGAGTVNRLADEFAETRRALDHSLASSPLKALESQVAALAARIEQIGGPMPDLARIVARLENVPTVDVVEQKLARLEAKLDAFAGGAFSPSAVTPASFGGTAELETLLRDLGRRIDAAQAPGDSSALDALERQVSALAARLDRTDIGTSIGSVERSLASLVADLGDWRRQQDGAAEQLARTAADSAARSALDAAVMKLRGNETPREDADRRATDALDAVHHALEKVVSRLAALEQRQAPAMPHVAEGPSLQPRPAAPAAQPRQPAPVLAPEPAPVSPNRDMLARAVRAARSGGAADPAPAAAEPPKASFWRQFAGRSSAPVKEPEPAPPRAAVAPDQPLEPGTGRPGRVAETSVISPDRPESLVAQARRAAQAAAEASRPAPARVAALGVAAANDGSAVQKLKAAVGGRKKPLLIGLAALVMALGTLQVMRTTFFADAPPPPAAPERVTPPPAAPSAPVAPAAAPVPAAPAAAPAPAPLTRGGSLLSPVDPTTVGALGRPGDSVAPAPVLDTAPKPAPTLPLTPAGKAPTLPFDIGPAPLRDAAIGGDAAAAYEVATRLVDGRHTRRDMKLAVQWFERAAEAGLAPAQYRLGSIYEKGIGVPRDSALARSWYARAAAAGNGKAMHNYAVLLAEGVDGKSDYPAAAQWFRQASEHGVRDSQYNFAILSARGLGTAQNLEDAYFWLSVAAGQGDDEAGRKRGEIAGKLAPDALDRLKAAVTAFKPKPLEPAANDVAAPPGGWDGQPKQSLIGKKGRPG